MPIEIGNRRILVVDDHPAIHEDFRKILGRTQESLAEVNQTEDELFGKTAREIQPICFEIDSAFQGQEALEKLKVATREQRPYALAFMDVRMPPGWDGVETVERLWQVDPQLQVVVCTAYADYSWEKMTSQLGSSDRFLILKKPFERIEVVQMAHSLAAKWELARRAALRMEELEVIVQERTQELRQSLEKVRTLHGLLPICASCKKIRDDKGYWNQVEVYLAQHTTAEFTHGLCPDCLQKLFPDIPPEGA